MQIDIKMSKKEKALDLIATVERHRSAFYDKWGKDRFLHLLDPDLKSRYLEMQNKYSAVIKGSNYLSIITMAEGMMRAFRICDENITKRGHEHLDSAIWDVTYEGNQYLIVKDPEYYQKAVRMAKKDKTTRTVWHVKELLKLIPEDSFIFTDAIKRNFPGAEVLEPTTTEDIKNVGPITPFLG